MNTMLRTFLAFAVLSPLCAQQQATTLLRLTAQADAVAIATAVGQSDPSPEWHRVDFRTDETLSGSIGSSFAALEPAGRCCGNALFAVEPGSQYLVFLARRGSAVHPLGGDRGILSASPELVAHVRALVAAKGDARRETSLLAASLQHQDERIGTDAALALAAHAAPAADAEAKASLRAALRRDAETPTTKLPALAAAVARAEGPAAADCIVPLYLETPADDAATALQRALLSLPAESVSTAARSCNLADETAALRTASLFEERTHPSQLDLLQRMLQSAKRPKVAAAVTQAMLAHDVSEESLRQRVPDAVLQVAKSRRREREAGSLPGATPVR